MKSITLHDLFILELQDIYDAEQQLVQALPKLEAAANTDDLKQAFHDHLEQTKNHVTRLEAIATQLKFELKGKKCQGMQGLIKEGEEMSKELEESVVKDLALIGAAQKVEHYEISGYGTLRSQAEELGHEDAYDLLDETLTEESDADDLLTQIAEQLMPELSV